MPFFGDTSAAVDAVKIAAQEFRPVIADLKSLIGTSQDVATMIHHVSGSVQPLVHSVNDSMNDSRAMFSEAREMCGDVRNVIRPIADAIESLGKSSDHVNDILGKLGAAIEEESVTKTVLSNVVTHMMGISACVIGMSNASSFSDVVTNGVAIFSMLGIESKLALALVNKFQTSGNDDSCSGTEDTTTQADWGKIAELLGSMSGILGKDSFLPACIGEWMKNASSTVRNVDALKKVWGMVEEVLAEFGINISEKMQNLAKIKATLEAVQEKGASIEMRFLTHASDFMKERYFREFVAYEKDVRELEGYLNSKHLCEMLPKTVQIKIANLAKTVTAQRQRIVVLRAQSGSRPCPIGVVLCGPSSIGKSKLTTEIINRVKTRLATLTEQPEYEFADGADEWSTWYQNSSDAYDQGYVSQEIHVVDDAFQASDDSDHMSYIQKISTTPHLTYQADLESKGTPYRSRLVIASCNVFPATSNVIKSVDALRNRFPVFIGCRVRPGMNAPGRDAGEYDPNFSWLDLQFVPLEGPPAISMSVDQIVRKIVTSLARSNQLYEKTLLHEQNKDNPLGVPIVEPHAGGDDDDTEDFVLANDEAGWVPVPSCSNKGKNLATDDIKVRRKLTIDEICEYAKYKNVNERIPIEDEDFNQLVAGGPPTIFEEEEAQDDIGRTGSMSPTWSPCTERMRTVVNDPYTIRISNMRQHPLYYELGRVKFVTSTRVYKAYDLMAVDESLYNPTTFYGVIGHLKPIGPIGTEQLTKFLKIPVVCLDDQGDRDWIDGVYDGEGSFCLGEDGNFEPTWYEKTKSKFWEKYSEWMSFSDLYKNDSWICKFLAVVWSPVSRVLLGIAALCGHSERSSVAQTIILWMDYIALASATPIMGMLLGVVAYVVGRMYTMLRFWAGGVSFCDAVRWSGPLSDKEIRAYLSTGKKTVSLLRSPPNVEMAPRHNAWARLYGWPEWEWVNGHWVMIDKKDSDVSETKVVDHVVMNEMTETEMLIDFVADESSEQDHNRQQKRELARDSKPVKAKIQVESSEQTHSRIQKREFAKSTKPSKANVESAEAVHNRSDKRALAKQSKPKKVLVECAEGDVEVDCLDKEVIVESGRAPTVKYATKEQVIQTTEVVKEYLNSTKRVRYDIQPMVDISRKPTDTSGETLPLTVDVEGCADPNCVDVVRKVAEKHTVWIKTGGSCYCAAIVTGEFALFPAHMAKMGEPITLYKFKTKPIVLDEVFAQGIVAARSEEWDLAIARIDKKCKDIDSLFVNDHSYFSAGRMGIYLQFLPIIQSFVVVSASYRETISVNERNRDIVVPKVYQERLYVSGLSAQGTVTQPGDCGGIIGVMNARSSRKLVGFHSAGSTSASFATILTEERILQMKQLAGEVGIVDVHSCKTSEIVWDTADDLNFNMKFMVPEDQEEAQHFVGGDLSYLGDVSIVSKPVGEDTGLKLAPFSLPFPEVMTRPSVLTETDPRLVDSDCLTKDRLGYPSILMTQMKKYASSPVEVDQGILDILVDQLVSHYGTILADEELGVPQNAQRAEWEMVNGNPDDEHYKPLALKASAGFPWAEFGKSKKVQFLRPITVTCEGSKREGWWFDETDEASHLMYSVFRHKLDRARVGVRTHSVWKDCLKDELRPMEKVVLGKTRAFTAAPFESVLVMRYLFGRFKAAHTRAFLRCNHAVGVNPMSVQWCEIFNYLQSKGSRVLDGDFSSFDGSIPRQFMDAAGEVIIQVIDENSHDGFEKARRVMWSEIVDTMQVSWSTLYMKHHGNNSGQPLTTPTNCIALFLMMWYVYTKAVGTTSLDHFLTNVAFVDFGDDNVQNVSSEVTDVYNPNVVQDEMAKLGMVFTPATKEGAVRWQTIDEVTFLKRKFIFKTQNFILAPLELVSIQQCFNYSLLEATDYVGWKNTIHEQLLEAALHGKRTYDRIAKILKACIRKPMFDKLLREAVSPEVARSYEGAMEEVRERYGLSAKIRT